MLVTFYQVLRLQGNVYCCYLLLDPFACPPGWVRKERLCYYFSDANDKQSWLSAESSCASMGADLGYIGDATAESFITSKFQCNDNHLFSSQKRLKTSQ